MVSYPIAAAANLLYSSSDKEERSAYYTKVAKLNEVDTKTYQDIVGRNKVALASKVLYQLAKDIEADKASKQITELFPTIYKEFIAKAAREYEDSPKTPINKNSDYELLGYAANILSEMNEGEKFLITTLCKQSHKEGYEDGVKNGHKKGWDEGHHDGLYFGVRLGAIGCFIVGVGISVAVYFISNKHDVVKSEKQKTEQVQKTGAPKPVQP